jgi:hypothetical protein
LPAFAADTDAFAALRGQHIAASTDDEEIRRRGIEVRLDTRLTAAVDRRIVLDDGSAFRRARSCEPRA